jgi:calcium/calmodulin-dependent protein kinase I
MATTTTTTTATDQSLQDAAAVIKKGINCTDVYNITRVMGQGGFATVKLGKRKDDGSAVAVKIIKKDALTVSDTKNLGSEIIVMASMKHANIVQLLEVYEDTKHVYLVMELMQGGELFDRIVQKENYSEVEAKVAFRDILSALEYLHSKNVVHRDLKPENLLYKDKTDASLKLADFGFAQVVAPNQLLTTSCGSPNYVAPEIINKESKGYDYRADLWSVGVILFVLLAGYPPFYEEDMDALFLQVIRGQYEMDPEDWCYISEDAKDLVKKLLVVNPEQRIPIEAIMVHPWIVKTLEKKNHPHLSRAASNLKSYNLRRKFKGAVDVVRSVRRMSLHGVVSGKLTDGTAGAFIPTLTKSTDDATHEGDNDLSDGKIAGDGGKGSHAKVGGSATEKP